MLCWGFAILKFLFTIPSSVRMTLFYSGPVGHHAIACIWIAAAEVLSGAGQMQGNKTILEANELPVAARRMSTAYGRPLV